MTQTLLTFLGRTPRGNNGYRKTAYDFGDSCESQPVAFFGWALQQRIKPQRMVILGTPGSMWDHLFEGDIDFGSSMEDARLELGEAVDAQQVSPAHLLALETILSERLACEVKLVLTPYCRNEREQVELLRIMAEHVHESDSVHLDVTHGFRHLPMLALLSALHLQAVKNATIQAIWYGAYNPDTGKAPVYDLKGMLQISDWIQSLHTYQKDGDYGVFSDLLGDSGEQLAKAAFYERTSNPVKARETLIGWTSNEERFSTDDPAVELFKDEIENRVSWYKGRERADWEQSLAYSYLEKKDYLRAAIYGMEGVISAQAFLKVNDYDAREDARSELVSNKPGFKQLQWLRNAMAHGVKPRDRHIAKTMGAETDLKATLKSLFKQLFD